MDADKKKHLIKLLGMIGSAHDGEVLNAAKLAQRVLGQEGMTWEELLNGVKSNNNNNDYQIGYSTGYKTGYERGVTDGIGRSMTRARPPSWYNFVKTLHEDYLDDLTDWEQGFVENWVAHHWNNPSPKQRVVLERIADKLGIDCPEA